jgi:hypothetical protein
MPFELPVHKLIQLDDEFAEFFRDPEKITELGQSGCVYNASPRSEIRLEASDSVANPWILLRNDQHIYCLISLNRQRKHWATRFAPDPKRVLEHIRPHFKSWLDLAPLIHAAGAREETGDSGLGKLENPHYLQRLMTEAYLGTDPIEFIRRRIYFLTNPGPATRGG